MKVLTDPRGKNSKHWLSPKLKFELKSHKYAVHFESILEKCSRDEKKALEIHKRELHDCGKLLQNHMKAHPLWIRKKAAKGKFQCQKKRGRSEVAAKAAKTFRKPRLQKDVLDSLVQKPFKNHTPDANNANGFQYVRKRVTKAKKSQVRPHQQVCCCLNLTLSHFTQHVNLCSIMM